MVMLVPLSIRSSGPNLLNQRMLISVGSLVRLFIHLSQLRDRQSLKQCVGFLERSYKCDLFLYRYLLPALPLVVGGGLCEAVLNDANAPELLLLTRIVMGYLN